MGPWDSLSLSLVFSPLWWRRCCLWDCWALSQGSARWVPYVTAVAS